MAPGHAEGGARPGSLCWSPLSARMAWEGDPLPARWGRAARERTMRPRHLAEAFQGVGGRECPGPRLQQEAGPWEPLVLAGLGWAAAFHVHALMRGLVGTRAGTGTTGVLKTHEDVFGRWSDGAGGAKATAA